MMRAQHLESRLLFISFKILPSYKEYKNKYVHPYRLVLTIFQVVSKFAEISKTAILTHCDADFCTLLKRLRLGLR